MQRRSVALDWALEFEPLTLRPDARGAKLAVFDVAAADVNNNLALLNLGGDSTVIINVHGSSVTFGGHGITNFNAGPEVTFALFVWGAARVGVPPQVVASPLGLAKDIPEGSVSLTLMPVSPDVFAFPMVRVSVFGELSGVVAELNDFVKEGAEIAGGAEPVSVTVPPFLMK